MKKRNSRIPSKSLLGILLTLAMIVTLSIPLAAVEMPTGNTYVNTFDTLNGTEVIRHDTEENQYVEKLGGLRLFRASGTGHPVILFDRNAPQLADGTISVQFDGKAFEAGIVFRYVDENNFLRVTANWNNGFVWVSQWINGEGSNLEGYSISEADNPELKVEFSGSSITVWWAGNQLGTVNSAAIVSAGACGISNTGDTSMSDGSFVVRSFTVSDGVSDYVNTFATDAGTELVGVDDPANQNATFGLYGGGVRLVRASGSNGRLILLDKTAQFADGAVSVQFSGKAYEASAVFRYQDDDNCMMATVNWNNALLHLSQWVNGEGVNLTGGGVAISEKTDAELLVVFEGSNVDVYWGGELVASCNDAALTSAGYCGISNSGDTSLSDGSFVVSQLAITAPATVAPPTGDPVVLLIGGSVLALGCVAVCAASSRKKKSK